MGDQFLTATGASRIGGRLHGGRRAHRAQGLLEGGQLGTDQLTGFTQRSRGRLLCKHVQIGTKGSHFGLQAM